MTLVDVLLMCIHPVHKVLACAPHCARAYMEDKS